MPRMAALCAFRGDRCGGLLQHSGLDVAKFRGAMGVGELHRLCDVRPTLAVACGIVRLGCHLAPGILHTGVWDAGSDDVG